MRLGKGFQTHRLVAVNAGHLSVDAAAVAQDAADLVVLSSTLTFTGDQLLETSKLFLREISFGLLILVAHGAAQFEWKRDISKVASVQVVAIPVGCLELPVIVDGCHGRQKETSFSNPVLGTFVELEIN